MGGREGRREKERERGREQKRQRRGRDGERVWKGGREREEGERKGGSVKVDE